MYGSWVTLIWNKKRSKTRTFFPNHNKSLTRYHLTPSVLNTLMVIYIIVDTLPLIRCYTTSNTPYTPLKKEVKHYTTSPLPHHYLKPKSFLTPGCGSGMRRGDKKFGGNRHSSDFDTTDPLLKRNGGYVPITGTQIFEFKYPGNTGITEINMILWHKINYEKWKSNNENRNLCMFLFHYIAKTIHIQH